jgi:UDP-N-acetylmuramoyl-tripeptide--D-alanyl-D-alanine ligase
VSLLDVTLAPVSDDRRAADAAPRRHDAGTAGFGAAEIVSLTGGGLLRRSPRLARGAAVDSRRVRPGNVFIALAGERTDGHRFLPEAAAAGAAALIVSRSPDVPLDALGDVSVIRVDDALGALHRLAASWRGRFDPLVVGVTGSIAKTSAKEAIASVLGRRYRALKNEGNLNNEIGLPLTVLDLDAEHDAAVLEMGMYVGGEIADLARIARPSIGVVTAVQGVHLSRIGSLDAIEQAKGELVEALPRDGTAVLNADDARVRRMADRTDARVLTYGFGRDADVTALEVTSSGLDGMRFRLRAGNLDRPVTIPTLGRLSVHNALAAAAVGLAAGLSVEEIAAGLADGWTAPHRGEVVRAGAITIIDDAYNASPGSVTAALELLAGLPGRPVAVLGEMLELGEAHRAGHLEVGRVAAGTAAELVVVGDGAAAIAEGAVAGGMAPDRVAIVPDRDVARHILIERLRPGDTVLVKASRGAALEVLVNELRLALAGIDRDAEARPDPGAEGGSDAGPGGQGREGGPRC